MVEPGAEIAGLRRDLGELLRERRDSSGRKLEALSRDLARVEGLEREPTSRASLSRFENGEKTPPMAVVVAVLKITKTDQATTRRALVLLERIKVAADSRGAESGTPPPRLWHRQVWRGVRVWHVASSVVLVVGVVAAIVLIPGGQGTGGPPAGTTTNGFDAAPEEGIQPCASDVVRAVSKKNRARAEFCPDHEQVLLYDDKSDNKSAILAVRRNGDELPPFFNSAGFERRNPDGSIYRVPPKPISISVGPDDTADFRVCFGDRNEERTYPPETCGDWTPFWPQG